MAGGGRRGGPPHLNAAAAAEQLANRRWNPRRGYSRVRVRFPTACAVGYYLSLRIPAMPITDSDLMAITIPSDADHRRSEATLGCSYHAEVIGIRQALCC